MNPNKLANSNNDGPAVFNMALNTLERLGDILRDYKSYSIYLDMDEGSRLLVKLRLVKNFFINASPLFQFDAKKEFGNAVLSLPIPIVEAYKSESGRIIPKGTMIKYDAQLEIKLDTLLVEMQSELQKESYFMPPKNDPRFAFARE